MSHRDLPVNVIKRNQKEAQLFRVISSLLQTTARDDDNLKDITITRVSLSSDKSTCIVFFLNVLDSQTQPLKSNLDKLDFLKAYTPSIRKALSKQIKGRYVPKIRFRFDDKFEKQQTVEHLLDKIKNNN